MMQEKREGVNSGGEKESKVCRGGGGRSKDFKEEETKKGRKEGKKEVKKI